MKLLRVLLTAIVLAFAWNVSPVSAHDYSCGGNGTGAMVVLYGGDTWGSEAAVKCSGDFALSDGFGTSNENWSNRANLMVITGDEADRYICLYNYAGYQSLIAQYALDAHEDRHIDISDNVVSSILNIQRVANPNGCPPGD